VCGFQYNAILSGCQNTTISGYYDLVLGGYANTVVSFFHGTIINGWGNTVSGNYNTIVNGVQNIASCCFGGILGGCCNVISNDISFIVGSNITTDRVCTTFVNNLSIKNIPTAAAGLPSGSVWRNGNILNIVP
jgi:hypothetical protein